MAVDAALANWLQSPYRYAGTTSDPVGAAWGDLAVTSEIGTPLLYKADALAEAARQHGFLLKPTVIDTVELPGLRIDLVGKVIEFFADDGGYAAGAHIFVLAAEEQAEVEATVLTVLRRLS
ncbi:hypothetical protein [uncultured Sphingobium sp.]|uniref:hypothetical protein n=1 Tax=uncultured Sphingobium sp. TaxID=316087 RepID=UPI00259AEDB0|nr:hypothetical protein [uncultured Sphingobium sp.]